MENNKEILISIVIPVKNGGPWIDNCIRSIMGQSLHSKTEIIIIDSGSTDNTLELLKKYPVRLFSIPAGEFNHGLTRNFGVSHCKGKYVAFTVQDAVPADVNWLEKLFDCFSDELIAGVCGRQVVPHDPNYNPLDWYRPASSPIIRRYQFTPPQSFFKLTPSEKKGVCAWDNVTAMYRKDILLGLPFEKTVFAEDIIWAKNALLNGYAIVYNPAAQVYHYHFEDREYVFKRTLTTLYFRYKYLGDIPEFRSYKLRNILSMVKSIFGAEGIALKKKFYWLRYNIERIKVTKSVIKLFKESLAKSESELDLVHQRICGVPPIPVKFSKL